jgi:hypothetical protein
MVRMGDDANERAERTQAERFSHITSGPMAPTLKPLAADGIVC